MLKLPSLIVYTPFNFIFSGGRKMKYKEIVKGSNKDDDFVEVEIELSENIFDPIGKN